MPAAYAHMTLVRLASELPRLEALGLPDFTKKALQKFQGYLALGAISPDLPYLGGEKDWADTMHHEKTMQLVKFMAGIIRAMPDGHDKGRQLAWLLGYVAHVGADVTIHPVVNLRVGGGYEEFPEDHRRCEMSQDVYVFRRLNIGEIGVGEYIDINIAQHRDSDSKLDQNIAQLWDSALRETYPERYKEDKPNIGRWYLGFTTALDAAEEVAKASGEKNKLFAFARHVVSGLAYDYPNTPDPSYLNPLKTPFGDMHYDEIFDRAIANVSALWVLLSRFIVEKDDAAFDTLLDWNLDTGIAPNGEMTMWRKEHA